ncbi:hypothetical protein KSP40_PGU013819 [Platanthera guangdongensis]|uniref:BLOC-1-related complex subunit 6 C-terminal helix domain-containing protein n=1 Tax=Platanthera guangdongensis TaxID=2320717 RepID=A0ABR2MP59_9ASPA
MAEIGTEPPEAAAHAAIRADRAVNPFVLAGREEILGETPRSDAESGENFLKKKPSEDRREVFRALEAVEKNTAAIAESYASLFSTLRLALSEVTSTSIENIQCLSDVVGSLQVSALDAASKGNRYINSCLRLNEELKSLEDLALQLKMLRKNVDALELCVNRVLRLP